MASFSSPGHSAKLIELKGRLDKCTRLSLDWNLYPEHIKKFEFNGTA